MTPVAKLHKLNNPTQSTGQRKKKKKQSAIINKPSFISLLTPMLFPCLEGWQQQAALRASQIDTHLREGVIAGSGATSAPGTHTPKSLPPLSFTLSHRLPTLWCFPPSHLHVWIQTLDFVAAKNTTFGLKADGLEPASWRMPPLRDTARWFGAWKWLKIEISALRRVVLLPCRAPSPANGTFLEQRHLWNKVTARRRNKSCQKVEVKSLLLFKCMKCFSLGSLWMAVWWKQNRINFTKVGLVWQTDRKYFVIPLEALVNLSECALNWLVVFFVLFFFF